MSDSILSRTDPGPIGRQGAHGIRDSVGRQGTSLRENLQVDDKSSIPCLWYPCIELSKNPILKVIREGCQQ